MGQVSKLGYVDAKLGAPTSGQQTTRVLYHTSLGNGNTATFFKNFNGLSLGQTNLNQGKLDSMESMVIKTISFLNVEDTTPQTARFFGGGGNYLVSVVVGNQKVVKDLPFFNQGNQWYDRLHGTWQVTQGTIPEIRLLTDIVIPPQVEFYVTLEGAPGSFIENAACVLSGYGKIFSAGASF